MFNTRIGEISFFPCPRNIDTVGCVPRYPPIFLRNSMEPDFHLGPTRAIPEATSVETTVLMRRTKRIEHFLPLVVLGGRSSMSDANFVKQ